MHITLIYFVVILLCASVHSTQQDELSDKEVVRAYVHSFLNKLSNRKVEDRCATNLTAEQIIFGQRKLNEFIDCYRIVVDKLYDRYDDNMTIKEFGERPVRLFPPICGLFSDVFKCFKDFEPLLDLCLKPDLIQKKDNGFVLAPMIYDSVCAENGTVFVDFATQPDSERCFKLVVADSTVNDLIKQLVHTTNDIWGSESDCEKLSQLQTQFLDIIRSCSNSDLMWNSAKRLVGNFCGKTKCEQLVSNFKCIE